MTFCKCGWEIYQAVLNSEEYERTGDVKLGWAHCAVEGNRNPIRAAVLLDQDHTPEPKESEDE